MKRIDQILSNLGYCTRSQAREWLSRDRVTVHGVGVQSPSLKVNPEEVRVDGLPLEFPNGILCMLHKPAGYVCSHSDAEGPTIYDLLPQRWRKRNPPPTSIGRLDKDTSGLLLITDQMGLVHELTSPRRKVAKVYHATVDRILDPDLMSIFSSGTLRLDGETDPCMPATLKITGSKEAELIIYEGRYHQVRRMFASVGYEVVTLHRSKMGEYELGDLPTGQLRHFR